jgi:hypothetical protein
MAEETRRRIMFYDEDLKEWVIAMFEEDQIRQNDIESSEKKSQDLILPFSHAAL